jgi:ABC-2 type transport system permease protein
MSVERRSTDAVGGFHVFLDELRKVPAFFRRDLLVLLSYRLAFVGDWVNLVLQVVIFYFVGRMIDPSRLPVVGGVRVSYMEFVAVGIALTSFVQISLGRVVSVIRTEQMLGTLEALIVTPTSFTTIQLGSVAYDLVYIPIRIGLFLGLASVAFDVHIVASGFIPALTIVAFFIPFVWGLGAVGAAGVLTFRRGSGLVGVGVSALTIASGTYFPLSVLPAWLRWVAAHNPITLSLDGLREVLLAGTGWASVFPTIRVLAPVAAVSLAVGIVALRLAIRRERRLGTLGSY